MTMTTSPDFSIRHYLHDDEADASQAQPPTNTPSQQHLAEAEEQDVHRASIDSTSSSRRSSIQGHLERLRRRTAFNISGEERIEPIEINGDDAWPEEPVWDWFALDNVFHRPAPSSRGDFKHLICPLSPTSKPTREQEEPERAVKAYEDRHRPAEEIDVGPTDTTTNPAYLHSSRPLPDQQPAKPELGQNGIPLFCPPPQPHGHKRRSADDADGDDGHKKARKS
ncbi:hypothetical protein CEP54_012123 [Fusarium duplospermum]|uniref:Uncharacterized protein n=1 Tax=Fusarium duplospermum TaxID=1325734 RepID=A0A428PAI1_9HYPO|nr:hypothetical protein CEP54_012123 [Fusarium duplospermum]